MATNLMTGIADEILTELGNPTDISTGSIAFWVKTNVGKLNNVVFSGYAITGGEFSPGIDNEEKDILKSMYQAYYYQKKTVDSLGAASSNSVLETDENGMRVRLTNKNEIAKTYIMAKKDAEEQVKYLINQYRINKVRAKQIYSDDNTQWTNTVGQKQLNRI